MQAAGLAGGGIFLFGLNAGAGNPAGILAKEVISILYDPVGLFFLNPSSVNAETV